MTRKGPKETFTEEELANYKPNRQQKKGRPSKTKPKGSPVVGNQGKTLFGQPGAPKPGRTSRQAQFAMKAAEYAAVLAEGFLEQAKKEFDEAVARGDSREALALLSTNLLGLMKDQMDRHNGKAVNKVDLTSSDRSMSPADHSDAVLDALKRKHDPNA